MILSRFGSSFVNNRRFYIGLKKTYSILRCKGGKDMGTLTYKDKSYELDSMDFLKDFRSWDEDFAKGMAQRLGMREGLTKEQRNVINFIRETYSSMARCPNIYETCRMCGVSLKELKVFFPTGYLRGACRLAGITYKEGYTGQKAVDWPTNLAIQDANVIYEDKTYRVDVRGFLVDPDEWDIYYAIHRAFDMKIPGGKLTDKHWKIIKFLREYYKKNKKVPTVYETCEETNTGLEDLEQLFPDGYHRGAVKVAGLRIR
jgi:TusE/DsrC/DsvC family sulfur relay protein